MRGRKKYPDPSLNYERAVLKVFLPMVLNRIPDSIIEEVRSATDIVGLISEYVPLKRVGRSFKALCPFHTEKTPSFIVNPEKQIYHCFGCGAGGNVYSFLMEHEKISFFEALKFLAKRAGVTLPKLKRDIRIEGENDALYQANEFAANLYQKFLLNSRGEKAREYLGERGLKEETIQEFRLGYAPAAWDELLRAAQKISIPSLVLERAGLIIPREGESGYYDRFRNRLLFPLFNLSGRVIGFGGRVLDDKDEPKYLNSPETPIYQKGRNFYGLCQSKGEIRRLGKAIIVEGYFDLLIPYQNGIKNIVASLGTALTEEHARLLSRYAKEAILVYDADRAGEIASLRSLDILLEAGLDVRVVSLPEGNDPDSYIRKVGKGEFIRCLNQAEDFIEFKLKLVSSNLNLSEVPERLSVIEEALSTLCKIRGELKRRMYVQRIAEKFSLDEGLLLQTLTKMGKKREEKPSFLKNLQGQSRQWEREIVRLMINYPDFIRMVEEHLDLEAFSDGDCREAAKLLFENNRNNLPLNPGRLISLTEKGSVQRLLAEISLQPQEIVQADKILGDYILKLKRIQTARILKQLKTKIQEADIQGDAHSLLRLQEEYQRLKRNSLNL